MIHVSEEMKTKASDLAGQADGANTTKTDIGKYYIRRENKNLYSHD